MADTRQIKLGFILHGVGSTWHDWRHPDVDANASTNFDHYKRQARMAEKGKLDFLIVADNQAVTETSRPHYLSRFEPITILSALAGATSNIGLVATVSVVYSEPFNLARQIASLDHISGGRAAWNVVTSKLKETAENFSKPEHPMRNVCYEIATEYLDVVQGLWDSWEDGAIIADKDRGHFADLDRIHRLDHVGQHFSVRGPLNIKRCPQGQPVIFQAGSSEDARRFGARRADMIYAPGFAFDECRIFYEDLKSRALSYGRDTEKLGILSGIRPIVGATDSDAEAKYRELVAIEPLEAGLHDLSLCFGTHDFRRYSLDAPFPDVGHLATPSEEKAASQILAEVRAENLSLRDVVERLAAYRGPFVGSPETVANEMQRWFEHRAADGFIIFETLPGQLDLFVEHVIPILQDRGLFRREYEGATFRDSLGLSLPRNRYDTPRNSPVSAGLNGVP